MRLSSLVAVLAAALTACGATSTNQNVPSPVLGQSRVGLTGLGTSRPQSVSFGGDSTSVVSQIHWLSWGGAQAVGVGRSVWVWPGTCTGCNRPSEAHVVAFRLGTCDHRPAYTAFEWYFAQYGEHFDPTTYNNVCNNASQRAGSLPPEPMSCPSFLLTRRAAAAEVSVQNMSCRAGEVLIRALPTGPFTSERRFARNGFRCGTQGTHVLPEAFIACERDKETTSYRLSR